MADAVGPGRAEAALASGPTPHPRSPLRPVAAAEHAPRPAERCRASTDVSRVTDGVAEPRLDGERTVSPREHLRRSAHRVRRMARMETGLWSRSRARWCASATARWPWNRTSWRALGPTVDAPGGSEPRLPTATQNPPSRSGSWPAGDSAPAFANSLRKQGGAHPCILCLFRHERSAGGASGQDDHSGWSIAGCQTRLRPRSTPPRRRGGSETA